MAVVYDVVDAASSALAGDLGVRQAAVPAEIFEADDVDAVAICTSTHTHIDLLVAAAEAGKAAFVEKPLALDLADVDRGIAAAEAAGILVQVGFNRRFDPSHRYVRDRVAAGDIGDVHLVRISSRDPEPPPLMSLGESGGIFCDMTIHDFDMIRFITNSEVAEVYATGAVLIDEAIGNVGDLDTAVIVCHHAKRRHQYHRQQPAGGLRVRPAGGGIRLCWDGRLREPSDRRRGDPHRRRLPRADPALFLFGAVYPLLFGRVDGIHRHDGGRAVAGHPGRRAGPAGDRPGRVAIGARAPPCANRRDRLRTPTMSETAASGPIRPQPGPGRVLDITPETAGWDNVAFSVVELTPSGPWSGVESDRETAIVPLSGSGRVKAGEIDTAISRTSVFEELGRIVYLPPGTPYEITTDRSLVAAVGSAPAVGRYPARVIEPSEMRVELRGGGQSYRQVVHSLAHPLPAERLILYEVFVPRGTWSGWPPHCHDGRDGSPYLEEVYYFRLDRPEGYAMHPQLAHRGGLRRSGGGPRRRCGAGALGIPTRQSPAPAPTCTSSTTWPAT